MNNKIDMTGKEQLQKLWKERKNMQQVIHSAVKNSKTGKLSYEMLFQELTLRYGSISGKSGENVILKGILDNGLEMYCKLYTLICRSRTDSTSGILEEKRIFRRTVSYWNVRIN
ncbi:hypothetical protein [Mediterraneibacter faecis]|uniref:hypothetical protein n=1 Tax=Mediterraneibacter faecis TaxID=592978 RepID=UPI001EDFF881|nr:hypothetical protein [Mediterraneibacter faecis]MCG4547153.1 hypothetical protein [Mediterraneibacter faecis]